MPSDNDNSGNFNGKYESMSADELKDAVRTLMALPDNSFDPEEIMYISRLIAEREGDCPSQAPQIMDADTSWEIFSSTYCHSRGKNKHKTTSKRRRMSTPRKVIIIALTIAILLSILVASVSAGSGTLGTVIHSYRGTFTPLSSGEDLQEKNYDKEFPEQLKYIVEDMQMYDATYLLPSYIPDGFEFYRYNARHDDSWITSFNIMLERDDEHLIMEYRFHHLSDPSYATYEKSAEEPEEYVNGGTTYFIYKNVKRYNVMWLAEKGQIECSIGGVYDKDELIKIINSINGD